MLHRTALTTMAAALAVLALLVLAACFNEVRDTPAPSSAESVLAGESLNGASGVLSDTKPPPEAIPSVEPNQPKVVPGRAEAGLGGVGAPQRGARRPGRLQLR